MPFEALKRKTRDRKYAIDELKDVLSKLKKDMGKFDAVQNPSDVAKRLELCADALKKVKRKFEDIRVPESQDCSRTQARLLHLQELGKPETNGYINWNRKRVDRILVDYMLRRGYIKSAETLAFSKSLMDVTDIHIFREVVDVFEALHNHECGPALRWCEKHASRLNKHHSPLQFQLHVQEYIELIRQGNIVEALMYGRAKLARWAEQRPDELQKAAALLSFPSDTQCEPYASMFSAKRWDDLKQLFKVELLWLHGLPKASILEAHLQAGLSALKSSKSMASDSCRQDPLHLPSFRELAKDLPSAKHVHSKLICAISGKTMSEHNPPLVLPNGYVYSTQALENLAAKNNGVVKCPITSDTYDFTELRRAFIM